MESKEATISKRFAANCKHCGASRLDSKMIDGVCEQCIAEVSKNGETKPTNGYTACLSCGRRTGRMKAERFFIDGRCIPCHKKLQLSEKRNDLLGFINNRVTLTEEEKKVVQENLGDGLLPGYIIEEMLIRIAAGQYFRDTIKYINSAYNLSLSEKAIVIRRYIDKPIFSPILDRLRESFDNKETRNLIPITNRFQMALRLESLYQEAEMTGNIKDRVMILKTAHDMLSLEEGKKAIQETNFLMIIQRIEENNRVQRAVSSNFSEPLALPPSRLDRMNGTTEYRGTIEVGK